MRSGKIYDGLSKIGDMFILNLIYILSCIPVITIGASTTALYYTTLKMAENKESYVWRDYCTRRLVGGRFRNAVRDGGCDHDGDRGGILGSP